MSNMQIEASPNSFGIWTGCGAASARIDAEFDKFRYLSLFDHVANTRNIVESNKYTVAPGGTIITLRESFLETLSDGTYDFHARFFDGNIKLDLTVSRNDSSEATQDDEETPQDSEDAPQSCCDAPQDDLDEAQDCCCAFDFKNCRKLILPIAILALSALVFAGTKCCQKQVKSICEK